ncbi:MAG: hypothetical protein KAS32_00140 [Candidatus Peribacteraceae bacterium]|nr:hypothetical protein [Candidatus Peribacteraceae bacterium]
MNVAHKKGAIAKIDKKIIEALPQGFVKALKESKTEEKKVSGDIELTQDGLDKLNVKALKKMAVEMGVELDAKAVKKDIIEAILIANEE